MLSKIESSLPGEKGSAVHDLATGAVAGLVATLPMTLVMFALFYLLLPRREQYPLPPRQITDRLLHRSGAGKAAPTNRQRLALTWVAHFGYGTIAGSLYPLMAEHLLRLPVALRGILYGILVWIVSYLGWIPAADVLPPATDQPTARNLVMILPHIIWGSAVGLLTERMKG